MGAFFTNVQVHTGGRPPTEVRDQVIAMLRSRVAQAGFLEVGDVADEEADRVVLIAPAGPEPWIAVYDEATEDQNEDDLRGLTEALSQVGGVAVGVLDHDSDILVLNLCRQGALIDVFNSKPDYFYTRSAEERAALVGQAPLWVDLLAPGVTADELRSAWDAHELFAEHQLDRIARLVGWNPAQCAIGFTYLSRGELDMTGFTRLAFRKAGVPRTPVAAEGPPRFVQGGGQQQVRLTVGTPFNSVGATFQSVSGAGRGLSVVVWGPAVSRGLVDVRTVVLVRRGAHGDIAEQRTVVLDARDSNQGPIKLITLEDFELPRVSTLAPGAGTSIRRASQAQMAAWLGLVLVGDALTAGEGELHVGVEPLENSAGRTSWTFQVTVSEP